jgi:small subunit ribosomal protein S9
MSTSKTTTTKKSAARPVSHFKAAAEKKPRVTKKKEPVHKVEKIEVAHVEAKPEAVKHEKPLAKDRYIFATGRRKTSIANVRLFSGKAENIVNKKPLEKYFGYSFHCEEALRPFAVTGLGKDYYFVCKISGGGTHSQAGALKHGIATALGTISPEIRKVLKKNGLLTRDDRKKERKKPGLKRARRSPQWAKR